MKRLFAALLAAAMLLSLCACGGGSGSVSAEHAPAGADDQEQARAAALYEKYADLIDRLEQQDYTGAMTQVAILSNSGKEQEEKTPITQLFSGDWYLSNTGTDKMNPPKKITLSDSGTVTLDGTDYVWMENSKGDSGMSGWLLKEGVHTYYLSLHRSAEDVVPNVQLSTVTDRGNGQFSSNDFVGSYYTDVMLGCLHRSWYNLDDKDSVMPRSFHVYSSHIGVNDNKYDWNVASCGDGTIEVKAGEAYTVTVELRGERPIALLTDNATGVSAAYYADPYKYDRRWPEYIYPEAVQYLNECQEDVAEGYEAGFYSYLEEEGKNLSGNEAWKYLYDVFTQLGDYKDSADIVGRFTILKDMYTGARIDRVDNMGNKSNSTYETMKYNKLGQLIQGMSDDLVRMYGMYKSDSVYLYYDDVGQLSSVQMGSGNYVSIVLTPNYDAQGRMVGAAYKSNYESHDYSYEYDAQGRLTENTVWNGNDRYQYTYTYDADGRLVKQVCWYGWSAPDYKSYRTTTDFTYDAQGHLVQKVAVRESYSSHSNKFSFVESTTVTYTNDGQGRPVSASIKVENYNNNYSYASETVTYNYGDLYYFD